MILRDDKPQNVHRPACQAEQSLAGLPSVEQDLLPVRTNSVFNTDSDSGQGTWNLVDGYLKQMNSQASCSSKAWLPLRLWAQSFACMLANTIFFFVVERMVMVLPAFSRE